MYRKAARQAFTLDECPNYSTKGNFYPFKEYVDYKPGFV
jgi:hypothetical protein